MVVLEAAVQTVEQEDQAEALGTTLSVAVLRRQQDKVMQEDLQTHGQVAEVVLELVVLRALLAIQEVQVAMDYLRP